MFIQYKLRWQLEGPLYPRPVHHTRTLGAMADSDAQQEAAEFLGRPLVGDTVRTNVRLERVITCYEEMTLPDLSGKVE